MAARRTARSTRSGNRWRWRSRCPCSVPNPKFARLLSARFCELRVQRDTRIIRLASVALVLASGLLEFDQRAAEVLGMQEQHRLVVRADLWRAVAEHARAFGLELVAGGQDVVDLVT